MSELSERLAALTSEQRARLSLQLSARAQVAPSPSASVPIAILGIGCRLPGGANSPDAFWERLCEGFDAVRSVPIERWDAERFFSCDISAAGKSNSRWGAFLDQVDLFDREYFGLSPREVTHMDPQQRLLLETAYEALEDAGQLTPQLSGCAAGVFIGAQSHSSDFYLMQARHPEQLDTYTATGTAHSILANRLSFMLDLRGPSLAVDTACSSSLVAVHMACQSLRLAECDLAIAGGVNLMLTPDFHICLGKLEMMAPDGRCKTFDHRANGFVRGEGCGVVILKRLPDALRDRDPVLAVILGSAVNQDGASNGLTAPNGLAQQAVIRRALQVAHVAPERVGYVETHGTGTALGDPIEVEALTCVLTSGNTAPTRCVLGAVKTNIGHLEAASGIAGLIKAVLSLQHGSIPPNLHFERLNPHLSVFADSFVLPSQAQPWPRGTEPRIAGVSSFGFGGTNAHVVLSDPAASGAPDEPAALPNHSYLLPISAHSEQALREMTSSYLEFFTTGAGTDLLPAAVAYTASLRRRHHRYRSCFVGSSAAQWAAAIRKKSDEPDHAAPILEDAAASVVFAYSGQGSQWPTMGSRLLRSEPMFRQALERCDALWCEHASWSIVAELSKPAHASRLHETQIAQPILFSLQVALTELWQSWGIEPAAVVGHSVGEVAAAYTAGVLSLSDALRIVFHRGRLMQHATGHGRMAALGVSLTETQSLIQTWGGRIGIAAINSPCSVVVWGDAVSLEDVVRSVSERGKFARLLAVDYAFHSPQMDAYGAELTRSLEGLRVMSARIPIVSTVSGAFAQPSDFAAAYWARNIRQPVLFAQAAQVLLDSGKGLFVEIGPHPVLCPAIAQCQTATNGPLLTVSSIRRDEDERHCLLESLGALHAAGCSVNWSRLFPEARQCVPLPRYRWQRQRYWLPPPMDKSAPVHDTGLPASWFYQLDWQAHSSLMRSAMSDSALSRVDVVQLLTALNGQISNGEPKGARRLLDELSCAYIWAALGTRGMALSMGSRWRKSALEHELHLSARYRRLARRLVDILVDAALIRDDGDHWTVVRSAPLDTTTLHQHLLAQCADAREVLQLHQRCGVALADVLSGECDPLSLLFAEDAGSSAEAIYRNASPSRLANRLTAQALRECVAQLPTDRTLRILEIGAGTGATSASLLPLCPAERCEYVFTDLSAAFLKRAAQTFARFPFVRYALLDLERPASEQGFAGNQFDLIVASNVVHATRDLALSLDHIRDLLAPSGMLFLVECTAPRPWMDITFGLTEGWWRFADHDRRDAHPLVNESTWLNLLGERGFCDPLAMPLQQPDSALFDQALIVARNSPHRAMTASARRAERSYLVFADSSELGDELKRQLLARGDACHLVRPGTSLEHLATDEFRACEAVIYLGTADRNTGDLVASTQRPLSVVQALLKSGASPAGGLWLITSGCQPAASSSSAVLGPEQALLWGLGRGVALEAPELGSRLIDLDPSETLDRSARALLAEIDDPGTEDQITLRRQQRYVARLKRAELPTAPLGTVRITDTHLVTGGLGGVGAQLARHLALAGAKHLVLVVRQPLPDRALWHTLPADSAALKRVTVVRELESLGARVTVAAIDLADDLSLAKLFTTLDLEQYPLRGIWHAAMSLSSASIGDLEPAAVRSMIEVKSGAAWRLHELSRSHPLDYFVLFSSTTALWGASGLAHYAAANAFLDALAQQRHSQHLAATVVDWGTWQQLNALSSIEQDRAIRAGMRPMAASTALRALDVILSAGMCHAIVADIDWSLFKSVYEARRQRPLLERLASESAPDLAAKQATSDAFVDRLARTMRDERREMLAQHVSQRLTGVLGSAAGDAIDRRRGFFDLGMDSITSIQLRRQLERDLRRSLPSTLTFNYSNIDLLTDFLLGELFPSVRDAAPPAPLEDIGDLDDDSTEQELFDQLAARLMAEQKR